MIEHTRGPANEKTEIDFMVRIEYGARIEGWLLKWERKRGEVEDLLRAEPQYEKTWRGRISLINAFISDLQVLRKVNLRGVPGDIRDFLKERAERFERLDLNFQGGYRHKYPKQKGNT